MPPVTRKRKNAVDAEETEETVETVIEGGMKAWGEVEKNTELKRLFGDESVSKGIPKRLLKREQALRDEFLNFCLWCSKLTSTEEVAPATGGRLLKILYSGGSDKIDVFLQGLYCLQETENEDQKRLAIATFAKANETDEKWLQKQTDFTRLSEEIKAVSVTDAYRKALRRDCILPLLRRHYYLASREENKKAANLIDTLYDKDLGTFFREFLALERPVCQKEHDARPKHCRDLLTFNESQTTAIIEECQRASENASKGENDIATELRNIATQISNATSAQVLKRARVKTKQDLGSSTEKAGSAAKVTASAEESGARFGGRNLRPRPGRVQPQDGAAGPSVPSSSKLPNKPNGAASSRRQVPRRGAATNHSGMADPGGLHSDSATISGKRVPQGQGVQTTLNRIQPVSQAEHEPFLPEDDRLPDLSDPNEQLLAEAERQGALDALETHQNNIQDDLTRDLVAEDSRTSELNDKRRDKARRDALDDDDDGSDGTFYEAGEEDIDIDEGEEDDDHPDGDGNNDDDHTTTRHAALDDQMDVDSNDVAEKEQLVDHDSSQVNTLVSTEDVAGESDYGVVDDGEESDGAAVAAQVAGEYNEDADTDSDDVMDISEPEPPIFSNVPYDVSCRQLPQMPKVHGDIVTAGQQLSDSIVRNWRKRQVKPSTGKRTLDDRREEDGVAESVDNTASIKRVRANEDMQYKNLSRLMREKLVFHKQGGPNILRRIAEDVKQLSPAGYFMTVFWLHHDGMISEGKIPPSAAKIISPLLELKKESSSEPCTHPDFACDNVECFRQWYVLCRREGEEKTFEEFYELCRCETAKIMSSPNDRHIIDAYREIFKTEVMIPFSERVIREHGLLDSLNIDCVTALSEEAGTKEKAAVSTLKDLRKRVDRNGQRWRSKGSVARGGHKASELAQPQAGAKPLEALRSKYRDLKKDYLALKVEKKELERRVNGLQTKEDSYEALLAKKGELEDSVADLQVDVQAKEEASTALLAEKSRLEESVADLQADVQAKEEASTALLAEKSRLEESVADLQADVQAKEEAYTALLAEKSGLEDSVADLQAALNKHGEEKETLQKTITSLEEQKEQNTIDHDRKKTKREEELLELRDKIKDLESSQDKDKSVQMELVSIVLESIEIRFALVDRPNNELKRQFDSLRLEMNGRTTGDIASIITRCKELNASKSLPSITEKLRDLEQQSHDAEQRCEAEREEKEVLLSALFEYVKTRFKLVNKPDQVLQKKFETLGIEVNKLKRTKAPNLDGRGILFKLSYELNFSQKLPVLTDRIAELEMRDKSTAQAHLGELMVYRQFLRSINEQTTNAGDITTALLSATLTEEFLSPHILAVFPKEFHQKVDWKVAPSKQQQPMNVISSAKYQEARKEVFNLLEQTNERMQQHKTDCAKQIQEQSKLDEDHAGRLQSFKKAAEEASDQVERLKGMLHDTMNEEAERWLEVALTSRILMGIIQEPVISTDDTDKDAVSKVDKARSEDTGHADRRDSTVQGILPGNRKPTDDEVLGWVHGCKCRCGRHFGSLAQRDYAVCDSAFQKVLSAEEFKHGGQSRACYLASLWVQYVVEEAAEMSKELRADVLEKKQESVRDRNTTTAKIGILNTELEEKNSKLASLEDKLVRSSIRESDLQGEVDTWVQEADGLLEAWRDCNPTTKRGKLAVGSITAYLKDHKQRMIAFVSYNPIDAHCQTLLEDTAETQIQADYIIKRKSNGVQEQNPEDRSPAPAETQKAGVVGRERGKWPEAVNLIEAVLDYLSASGINSAENGVKPEDNCSPDGRYNVVNGDSGTKIRNCLESGRLGTLNVLNRLHTLTCRQHDFRIPDDKDKWNRKSHSSCEQLFQEILPASVSDETPQSRFCHSALHAIVRIVEQHDESLTDMKDSFSTKQVELDAREAAAKQDREALQQKYTDLAASRSALEKQFGEKESESKWMSDFLGLIRQRLTGKEPPSGGIKLHKSFEHGGYAPFDEIESLHERQCGCEGFSSGNYAGCTAKFRQSLPDHMVAKVAEERIPIHEILAAIKDMHWSKKQLEEKLGSLEGSIKERNARAEEMERARLKVAEMKAKQHRKTCLLLAGSLMSLANDWIKGRANSEKEAAILQFLTSIATPPEEKTNETGNHVIDDPPVAVLEYFQQTAGSEDLTQTFTRLKATVTNMYAIEEVEKAQLETISLWTEANWDEETLDRISKAAIRGRWYGNKFISALQEKAPGQKVELKHKGNWDENDTRFERWKLIVELADQATTLAEFEKLLNGAHSYFLAKKSGWAARNDSRIVRIIVDHQDEFPGNWDDYNRSGKRSLKSLPGFYLLTTKILYLHQLAFEREPRASQSTHSSRSSASTALFLHDGVAAAHPDEAAMPGCFIKKIREELPSSSASQEDATKNSDGDKPGDSCPRCRNYTRLTSELQNMEDQLREQSKQIQHHQSESEMIAAERKAWGKFTAGVVQIFVPALLSEVLDQNLVKFDRLQELEEKLRLAEKDRQKAEIGRINLFAYFSASKKSRKGKAKAAHQWAQDAGFDGWLDSYYVKASEEGAWDLLISEKGQTGDDVAEKGGEITPRDAIATQCMPLIRRLIINQGYSEEREVQLRNSSEQVYTLWAVVERSLGLTALRAAFQKLQSCGKAGTLTPGHQVAFIMNELSKFRHFNEKITDMRTPENDDGVLESVSLVQFEDVEEKPMSAGDVQPVKSAVEEPQEGIVGTRQLCKTKEHHRIQTMISMWRVANGKAIDNPDCIRTSAVAGEIYCEEFIKYLRRNGIDLHLDPGERTPQSTIFWELYQELIEGIFSVKSYRGAEVMNSTLQAVTLERQGLNYFLDKWQSEMVTNLERCFGGIQGNAPTPTDILPADWVLQLSSVPLRLTSVPTQPAPTLTTVPATGDMTPETKNICEEMNSGPDYLVFKGTKYTLDGLYPAGKGYTALLKHQGRELRTGLMTIFSKSEISKYNTADIPMQNSAYVYRMCLAALSSEGSKFQLKPGTTLDLLHPCIRFGRIENRGKRLGCYNVRYRTGKLENEVTVKTLKAMGPHIEKRLEDWAKAKLEEKQLPSRPASGSTKDLSPSPATPNDFSDAPAGINKATPTQPPSLSGAVTPIHRATRLVPCPPGGRADIAAAPGPTPAPANFGQVPSSVRPENVQFGLFEPRRAIRFATESRETRQADDTATPAITTLVSDAVVPASPNTLLPDIDTDFDSDEDLESDKVPDWATMSNLETAIRAQEGTIPQGMSVGPFCINEVFPTEDESPKHLTRTSSANWAEDQLTEDEVQRDLEARRKLQGVDEWSYSLVEQALGPNRN